MSGSEKRGWLDQLLVATVFAVIGLAALCWFVIFAQPPEREHRAPFRADYSEQPLADALAGKGWEKSIADIAAAGIAPGERQVGRLTGSPGFYRTETLIADTFRKAGLDVLLQEFEVVVPVTESCEILGPDGLPLPGVTLYPFAPSGIIPTATPAEGLRGRLVATETSALKYLYGHRPEETIVLTSLDAAGEWASLASAGVKALVVFEDELARRLRSSRDIADPWWFRGTTESDYPIFLARGPVQSFAGRDISIRCRVTWQSRPARNILGVLRAGAPRQEALVLTAFYDSQSAVPELAPGAEQSFSPAVLIEYARALAPYRERLQRDIIFVATAAHAQGLAGVSRLVQAIEPFSPQRQDYRSFEERKRDEERKLGYAIRAGEWTASVCPTDGAAGEALPPPAWDRDAPEFATWIEESFSVVTGEINLDCREAALAAKLRHTRAGNPVFREGFDFATATDAERKSAENTHPLLRTYLEAKTVENRSANLMSMRPWEIVRHADFLTRGGPQRARQRFERLADCHRRRIKELDDLMAVREIFRPYARTLTLNLELYSGGERGLKDLSILVGIPKAGIAVEPQGSSLANALREKAPTLNGEPAWRLIYWGPRDAEGSTETPNANSPSYTELESEPWFLCGRLGFSIVNYRFFPPRVATPEDTLEAIGTNVIAQQATAIGEAILAIGFGRIPFKTIAPDLQSRVTCFAGTVFGSAGASSLVPTHRMTERTVVRPWAERAQWTTPQDARGVCLFPVVPVDAYGEYNRPIGFDVGEWGVVSVDAARFDENGRLTYARDSSPAAQTIYKSVRVIGSEITLSAGKRPKPMHVPVFRCSGVSLYDMGNPKTLKSFRQKAFLNRQGLAGPARSFTSAYMTFLDPDFQFYVGMMDGAVGNDQILAYRAFMLRADPDDPIAADEPDLSGRGYLTADTPLLAVPHIDAAASMLRTAEKRLRLQRRYGMADEQMLDFHERAKEWLADARQKREAKDPAGTSIAAGASLAYAINNHPVIRNRINQAIVGILWYLGLLVPFVFFAEKLFFGFADIRKQLLANGIIFLVVFALLRLFHPAFQMVRSSLVILLGFIIFLLTVLITTMVGGKFRQNIKELRRKEGRVEGADINRAGVIGTAFMLGLNNMRRRKIRTGLTCVTLVLITFVMICFTSVSTDLINVEYATGRSSWNGIMLRNPNFLPIDPAELANIRRIYGERFPVTSTSWLTPQLSAWSPERVANPEIVVDREFMVDGTKIVKRTRLSSAMLMDWNEPKFSGIDRYLRTERRWFPRPPTTRKEKMAAVGSGYRAKNYVILPDTAARELSLSVEDVNTQHPVVSIRGVEYEVLGILDPVDAAKCLGLDGQPILPFDLNSVQTMGSSGARLIVPEDIGRLSASQVMIVNVMPPLKATEQPLTVSCSILFPKEAYRLLPDSPEQPPAGYREQRRVVLEYLERVGAPAYYAIDGIAYYGSRQRAKTIAGLLEILVPIVLAALTVFNTMRGSVYERKEEIYVYNAVGIAPNHVFFIFMAEASVYAVVGALFGYLLSQGTGRLLTALHLTGGLNMDYSSIETIYASLAIVGATLLSTVLPAREAARLASPAGRVSWTMPRAAGDVMEFKLPFTFTTHDRVAVVSYFHRWLDANGAGSSGPFFCSPPAVCVREQAGGTGGAELVPSVESVIWLKPYDLGVSQRLTISLPTDPETAEYIANIRITRLSGHAVTWERRVKPFLTVVRKQFLNWRVTTESERGEMFAEAKRMLVESTGRANHG